MACWGHSEERATGPQQFGDLPEAPMWRSSTLPCERSGCSPSQHSLCPLRAGCMFGRKRTMQVSMSRGCPGPLGTSLGGSGPTLDSLVPASPLQCHMIPPWGLHVKCLLGTQPHCWLAEVRGQGAPAHTQISNCFSPGPVDVCGARAKEFGVSEFGVSASVLACAS